MPSPRITRDPLQLARQELVRLRQGAGLAHPTAALALSASLRRRLSAPADPATEAVRIVRALTGIINGLDRHHREHARVDFNLDERHSYPTLTERQESLAQELKCAAKTVRRHSDRALDTIAVRLLTGEYSGAPDQASAPPASVGERLGWRDTLAEFWRLSAGSAVDIICSEIPEEERPEFASPRDRNFLRYAKFADLDSLIYARTRLTQVMPPVTIRDFAPSEYDDAGADTLVIIGGPPWNAKFREFQPQLPFFFEPHPLGEDDPLVIPMLSARRLGPAWTTSAELLSDVAVFVRLTLRQGTTVFLLGGCLTLGVLGAAKCFLQEDRGAANARYVSELVGARDFVLVAEAARVGGITDVADLSATAPLLLSARDDDGRFEVLVDNTEHRPYP